MTPEERQALREKHSPCHHGGVTTNYCEGCDVMAKWPCDVIKVIDAWERHETRSQSSALSDTEPVSETDPNLSDCDHVVGRDETGWNMASQGDLDPSMARAYFFYCPDCGEKL